MSEIFVCGFWLLREGEGGEGFSGLGLLFCGKQKEMKKKLRGILIWFVGKAFNFWYGDYASVLAFTLQTPKKIWFPIHSTVYFPFQKSFLYQFLL